MIHLELPNVKYKETYISAVREFLEKGSDNESTDHYLREDVKDFNNFVEQLINESKGINLKKGRVPCTDFWLIDEKGKYCGRISLRHRLNTYLRNFGGHIGYDIIPSERGKGYASEALKLCLIEAKKIGINKILITCDDKNIASIKIIERNGGVLKNTVKEGEGFTRRYHISL